MYKLYKKNKLSLFALIASSLIAISSCKKALDILPEDKLDKSQVYNTLSDADAAIFGIYGKFAALGEKYIVLNELRADLMDVTSNADPYLQQISNHEADLNNPYIDPKAFYEIILNCNDALKNFKIMADKSKISQEDYQQRSSDLIALRSWLYLQLGIHFGSVPYVKDPIENIDDLKKNESYPKISFNQLLDFLIADTKNLPYLEYFAYPSTSSLTFTIDGSNTRKIFINKPALLGELYLWKGEYYNAATAYKMILTAEDANTNIAQLFNHNRIGWFDSADANIQVSFARSQEGGSLVNSLTEGWRSLFALSNTNRHWNTEWIWAIPYNNSFAPGNPFIELVSKQGKYKVKPSKSVIDLWNAQLLSNGVPGDARGTLSYNKTNPEEPVITKLTDAQTTLTLLNRGGQWNISRAAGAHLRFAEAANRDGHGKVGYALLNYGIKTTFYDGAYTAAGAMSAANFDELNTQITPYPENSAYYFDARDNNVVVRGVWYRNIGIRGRAMLPRIEFDEITYKDAERRIILDFQVPIVDLEDKIIEEAALELAFEGSRWSDLTRIARRRNDPSFLAEKVYQKHLKANNPKAAEIRAKLMNPDNWYLPFKWN
jgi:hypothetical protein